MSQSKESFHQTLKRGCEFEKIVFDFLLTQDGFTIMQTHDFKTEQYNGPRLYSKDNPSGTILPDFYVLSSTGNNFFVEAKLKKKPFRLVGRFEDYVAIDYKRVHDYRKAAGQFNADLFFCIGIESTDNVYLIPDDDNQFIKHKFNNQFSNGLSLCLPLDSQFLINK
jgi:hypothetical protein